MPKIQRIITEKYEDVIEAGNLNVRKKICSDKCKKEHKTKPK
jgi:hypothetical protein